MHSVNSSWWSDLVHFRSTQNHMAVRSSYIPPVNTEPHGGQIIVHSVNTEPHGCQIIVHSTSHHSTTWRSDLVHFRSTQNHMVVRLSCIPSTQYRMVVRSRAFPVNTEPHGGQIIVHSVNTVPHGGQISCISGQHRTTWRSDHRAFRQHRTTWRSDHRAFHLSTQYHIFDKSSCIPSTQNHRVVTWTACEEKERV